MIFHKYMSQIVIANKTSLSDAWYFGIWVPPQHLNVDIQCLKKKTKKKFNLFILGVRSLNELFSK